MNIYIAAFLFSIDSWYEYLSDVNIFEDSLLIGGDNHHFSARCGHTKKTPKGEETALSIIIRFRSNRSSLFKSTF